MELFPHPIKISRKNCRRKAVEFANKLINEGAPEGVAIATGLKKARLFFTPKAKRKPKN
jgi:uncharacterized protein YdaT